MIKRRRFITGLLAVVGSWLVPQIWRDKETIDLNAGFSEGFHVTFLWVYPLGVMVDKAIEIHNSFINIESLFKINDDFAKAGLLISTSSNFLDEVAIFNYTFASESAYKAWEEKKYELNWIAPLTSSNEGKASRPRIFNSYTKSWT